MNQTSASEKSPAWQFVQFCVVGLVNTLVGYASILAGELVLGLGPYAANAFGYGVGLTVSFALNRRYTFASQQAVLPGLSRFLLAFIPSYGLNLFILHVAVNWLVLPGYLAQAAAIATYTLAFFVLCRLFVFRGTGSQLPSAEAEAGARGTTTPHTLYPNPEETP